MSKDGQKARAEAKAAHHNAQASGTGKEAAARNLKEVQHAAKKISLEFALPPIVNDTVQDFRQSARC